MSKIREDFPFLQKHPEVAYFDNAATTLKPKSVIDEVVNYYENLSVNVHRGDFYLSNQTSDLYDDVRRRTAKFMNAQTNEIVFTSGASESLNLIAMSYGLYNLKKDDVILLNEAEHASNILPWYEVCEKTGSKIEFIPLGLEGKLNFEAFKNALHSKVKVVSLAHVSNVLGYVNDIKKLAAEVHKHNAIFVVDGAQSIGHLKVDVKDLDVDFFAYSAHKMFGPTGVGVMYGKYELLEDLHVNKVGGGSNVRFNSCGSVTYKKPPQKFESGTPNIEGVLGFGKAVDYLAEFGVENVHSQVLPLHKHLLEGLASMEHIVIYNKDADVGIVSLNVKDIFAQDVAAYLSTKGIAVRAGEHCAKLLNGVLNSERTVRISLYIYNTIEEVDRLLDALREVTLEKVVDIYL